MKEIAQEENLARDTVRDILNDARRNDYLSKPPRKGVAGGRLLEKGLERLREAGYLPEENEGGGTQ